MTIPFPHGIIYGIRSVTIENGVTRIGNFAFWKCIGLTSITIPNSVTSIGTVAFELCTSLTSITIPNSVTNIEDAAFSTCSGLTSIDVAVTNSAYTSENGVLFNKDKTELVSYPGGKVGKYVVPDSATSIGDYAFVNCDGLTSISIPNSVTSIGDWAFEGCSSLTDVYYSGTEEQWAAITIGSYNDPLKNATIHYNSTGSTAPTPTPTPSLGEITLRADKDTIDVGEELPIAASIYTPDGFSESDIIWTSSDDNIATVAPTGALVADYTSATALVTGISYGEVMITATLADGRQAQYSFTVAPSSSADPFNPYIYRADFLTDTSHPSANTLESFVGYESPSHILLNSKNVVFDIAVATWEIITTVVDSFESPSTISDFVLEKKNMYSAIILNNLEASSDFGHVDDCKAVIKDAKEFASIAKTDLKAEFDIDFFSSGAFSNKTDEEIRQTQDYIEKLFKKKYGDVDSINKVFKNFSNALDVADDLETFFERCASAYSLVNMGESLKEVVRMMYQECPASNLALKTALSDCIDIIDSSAADFEKNIFLNFFNIAGEEMATKLVDEFWESVTKACATKIPVLNILMAGYKVGKYAANILTNTDNIIEQTYKMIAAKEIDDLVVTT